MGTVMRGVGCYTPASVSGAHARARARQGNGHAPLQSGLVCFFLAQHAPESFILPPECCYPVVYLCIPVPGSGILEGDHTVAQRPQMRHNLHEVEGGVSCLQPLSLEEERERRRRECSEFGFRGHVAVVGRIKIVVKSTGLALVAQPLDRRV